MIVFSFSVCFFQMFPFPTYFVLGHCPVIRRGQEDEQRTQRHGVGVALTHWPASPLSCRGVKDSGEECLNVRVAFAFYMK